MTNTELIRQEIERRIGVMYNFSSGYSALNVCRELLDFIDSLQQEQPEVDLENYISNKLRELGDDLINSKLFAYTRGLNVGRTNAYRDILDRLNARKED